MSWYSKIYTWVREHRARHPISGWFLTRCLNILFLAQVVTFIYMYYVYAWVICECLLTSAIQAAIYLSVYTTLAGMSIISLIRTQITPIARVPSQYKADASLDRELKACTPMENGKYKVDKSSAEQTERQNELLGEFARRRGLLFAECDKEGRIRYCYECAHLKPDRAHHCSSCGQCVLKFDHHCPWINRCVSASNYKYFNLYVMWACVSIAWYAVTSVEALVRFWLLPDWHDNVHWFVQLMLALVPQCIFGYFPLGELFVYHYTLVAFNETTCEQIKGLCIRGDPKADYNQGKAQNRIDAFGWGLWAFPINTVTLHDTEFKVRYEEPNNPHKLSLKSYIRRSFFEIHDPPLPRPLPPPPSPPSPPSPPPSPPTRSRPRPPSFHLSDGDSEYEPLMDGVKFGVLFKNLSNPRPVSTELTDETSPLLEPTSL